MSPLPGTMVYALARCVLAFEAPAPGYTAYRSCGDGFQNEVSLVVSTELYGEVMILTSKLAVGWAPVVSIKVIE